MKKIFKYILNTIPRPLLIQLSYLVRPILALTLKGNVHQDPIDGKRFRKFLPYGYENPRENVLSPLYPLIGKASLIMVVPKNETNFFTEKNKVLHFAPEQAFYKRFCQLENLDYTTTDLNSPLADIKADICSLPFTDNSFDIILCNHVLEHIPDDTKAMKELYRVLKPGGWGILQIPQDLKGKPLFEDDSITDKQERAKIFGQYDHVRIYGWDFFAKLRQIGFEVEEVDYTATMVPEAIETYRLAHGEIIPLVRKTIPTTTL